jgi:hypothetical protein
MECVLCGELVDPIDSVKPICDDCQDDHPDCLEQLSPLAAIEEEEFFEIWDY